MSWRRKEGSRPPPPRRGRGGKQQRGRGGNIGPRPPITTPLEVSSRKIPGFKSLRYKASLRYVEEYPLNSGAASVGTYVFSANGLYDPNITGTGHQPAGFDSLMLSFEHYTTVYAVATVRFRNQMTNYPIYVGVSLNAGNTPVTDHVVLLENGQCVSAELEWAGSATSIVKLVMPISIGKFGGVPSLLSNPSYQGSVAANPVEQSYFHLSVWNPADTTVVTTNFSITIDYTAWFVEPRKVPLSLQKTFVRLMRDNLLTDEEKEILDAERLLIAESFESELFSDAPPSPHDTLLPGPRPPPGGPLLPFPVLIPPLVERKCTDCKYLPPSRKFALK